MFPLYFQATFSCRKADILIAQISIWLELADNMTIKCTQSCCSNMMKEKWCASQENRPQGLCRCHTKMGARGTDFSEFDSADIIDYILKKSVSCKKKDGHGHAHPSFFWYDNNKELKVCFLVTRVTWWRRNNTVRVKATLNFWAHLCTLHGGLICVAFCPSVCPAVRTWPKTRLTVNLYCRKY